MISRFSDGREIRRSEETLNLSLVSVGCAMELEAAGCYNCSLFEEYPVFLYDF